MKTTKILTILVVALGLILCQAKPSEAAPMGTAFTYQGHLYDNNSVADDFYDFQFKLYDANVGGSKAANDVNVADVDVIDGYFTVVLDFNEPNAFNGDARWLEIGVRPGVEIDPCSYEVLLLRQEITPTPYALHTRWLLVDTALNNIFAGKDAGASGTTGIYNSAMGSLALSSNTTGNWNSAMGGMTLQDNTTGSNNSAVGVGALRYNTTGRYNSAMGNSTLRYNTTGYYNTAMGNNALYSNTTGYYNTAIGYEALRLSTGNNNSAVGYNALRYNTTGNNNSAVGYNALRYNSTGNNNTAIGHQAGRGNNTGSGNVFLGYKAGYNATGDNKLYIANDSADANVLIYGDFSTGNVGIGTTAPSAKLDVVGNTELNGNVDINSDLDVDAGTLHVNGTNNRVGIGTTSPTAKLDVVGTGQMTGFKLATGASSGYVLTSDASGAGTWQAIAAGGDSDWTISDSNMYTGAGVTGNVGIGTTSPSEVLDVNGNININSVYKIGGETVLANTGPYNIFVGKDAGASITTGGYNSAVGYQALYDTNEGSTNSAMGFQALYSNTTGGSNSAMGYFALYFNTTGWGNSAMGNYALWSNTTGYLNSAVGKGALRSNTTGHRNSAVGESALYYNIDGRQNSAMGYFALRFNASGNYNSAMGNDALYSNTTGGYNSAMGSSALYSNIGGKLNSAMGQSALRSNTTGNNNTAIGYEAGYSNSTGSDNVFLGNQAGYNEQGSDKLYIDNSDTSTPLIYGNFSTNRVGINRVPTARALEVEGDASKTTASGWAANSDERIKADIQTVTGALETLDKVRLVSFKYTDDYQAKHPSIEKRRYLNVIAQEFRQVFPEYVKSSGEKLANGEEILQVDAYPLTVYSAAAVQELYSIVKAKDAEISGLKERISRIETVLAKLAHEQEGNIK